jgi:hypothetical protein
MYGKFEGMARMRHGWGPGGGGRGRGAQPEPPPADDVAAWFTGRLPDNWFTSAPDITVDREEILVVGELAVPTQEFTDEAAAAAAAAGRISRYREDTRDERIEIARQAEHRYGRKVAWGARIGDTAELFTTLSVPVMTRLRQPERLVLDTLVNAGVARSRSEALAWAVRLVGEHAEAWLTELRTAMSTVDDLRREGPDLS